MSDQPGNELDESVLLSDRTSNSEFFIDDYSHLRLSYYQYRDNISLNVSDSIYPDSTYYTNASTNENHENSTNSTNAATENNNLNSTTQNSTKSINATTSIVLNEQEKRNATPERHRENKDLSNANTNSTISTNATNSKVLNEEKKRNPTPERHRENKDLSNANTNSTISTNATNSKVLDELEKRNATPERYRENKDLSSANTNSTISTNATNSKVLNDDERRKLREYLVSQIPDLPHPSYTAASIIASASHRMDPSNRFVYNNRIEQGNRRDEDFEMETFTPERRSTLKPDTKL
ncbi:uncharacterized protein YBL113C-like isoform X2 [Maniola jurtina]|uniref:uncharacterized protein YBL113C-like isoform X2 n=1 Tax=Maniola jurtina TaxID=191418 RepID=UPI001E68C01F|nr:uncharacterized protein YBL113C-like isoform X2 [Maniola jurtina]